MAWFIPALAVLGAGSGIVSSFSKRKSGSVQRRQAWDEWTKNYIEIQKRKEYQKAVSTRYATGGAFLQDIYNDVNFQIDYLEQNRKNLFRRISSWEGGAFSFFVSMASGAFSGFVQGTNLENALAQKASKFKDFALLGGEYLNQNFVKDFASFNSQKQFSQNINASMELSRRSSFRDELVSRPINTGGDLV